jgi:hypothetical protein
MRLLKKKQQLKDGGATSAPPVPLPTLPAVVRVRMLRKAFTAWGFMEAGRTANVPGSVAARWIAAGIAEMDKALDGPSETK